MIRDDGINRANPSQYRSLTSLKFLFLIITIILTLMIWFSFDYNIFTGLPLDAERHKNEGSTSSSTSGTTGGTTGDSTTTASNNFEIDYTEDYKKAYKIVVSGLSFQSIFITIEFIIQITGLTYYFNQGNAIIVMLKIFESFLLFYYFIDAWHYVIIWYIFIVTQLITTIIEIVSLIYSIFYKFNKYNKIRTNDVTMLEKEKNE